MAIFNSYVKLPEGNVPSRCADTLYNKDVLYQAKSIDVRPDPPVAVVKGCYRCPRVCEY